MSEPATALRLEVLDGNLGLLTLDQPGSRANTLGQAVLGELERRVADLTGRTQLRGLLLRSGKPGMFFHLGEYYPPCRFALSPASTTTRKRWRLTG